MHAVVEKRIAERLARWRSFTDGGSRVPFMFHVHFSLPAEEAALHVAAALKHQLLDRDGLVLRMLPGRS